jgi:hypothetical protein
MNDLVDIESTGDLTITKGGGFITQPQRSLMPPSMMAEVQRAKSEVEAALTVAQCKPRDQKRAMDNIITSFQRPELAKKAKYRYARGGTDIVGPTIDSMEVIAQLWGNLDFGFRELARYPGTPSEPGESVVEATAWDLESNTRRRTQFTVSHSEQTKRGLKVFTDPRDIYEWVANQAQRRVRTCLENIIPCDVVDAAMKQADKTLVAAVDMKPETIAKLVTAFEQFGVTKDAIEARIQRRMDAITPAQVVYLRDIWAGIRDGISRPEDWFASVRKTDSVAEELKSKDGQSKHSTQRPQQDADAEQAQPEPTTAESEEVAQWLADIPQMDLIDNLEASKKLVAGKAWSDGNKEIVTVAINKQISDLRPKRGDRA